MTPVFRGLARLPLWLLQGLGWWLGWLSFLLSASYRGKFRQHVAQAGYRLPQVLGAVGAAGRMVGELPRLWLGAPVPCAWDNEACIERAYAGGRGVIFLTPHLGCFEISAQAVAARYAAQHGPLTVLYRPARQAWLARLMLVARERPGLTTAPTSLAGVRQMIRSLRSGHAVGLLPDQVPPDGMGVWSPFFGRPAYTMTLAARLAQQTGAVVLLAWSERLACGRGFLLHFRELREPLAADLETAVGQINQEMEQLIRQCPAQYLWGYARYKKPKGAP